MSVGLAHMFLLKEQSQIGAGERWMLEGRTALDVIRARRPCEVMHIVLSVMMRGRAVGLVAPISLATGCTHDPASRNGEPHVVGAEIGEEFRSDVKLMAVPSAV